MKKPTQQEITEQNAQYVRQWFETSGFFSKRLDTHSGKKGKSADWKFTKQDLTVICEVKTIFSGGRAGKWVEGADNAEGTYRHFKRKLENNLQSDPDISHEPFDITMSISRLYVPYGNQYEQFYEWLKGYVLWAKQGHSSERLHTHYTFKFEPDHRNEDRSWYHGAEAFVQMMGPGLLPELEVGFIEGGVAYNNEAVMREIATAMTQIQCSVQREKDKSAQQVIAFWSYSSFLWFSRLLLDDVVDTQLNRLPTRFDLFDRAFETYPDLSAIALFELRSLEKVDPWEFTDPSKLIPFAYVITNPSKPEKSIKTLHDEITQHRVFIPGFEIHPASN